MACYLGLGTDSNFAGDQIIPVVVQTGDTVTVANNTNSVNTINYLSGGFNGGATGTITAGNSHNLTIVGTHYLTCAGHADVKLTGGVYGL